MTRLAYTLLLRLCAPLIWLWMRMRAGRASGEWEILSPARFGRYLPEEAPPGTKHRIWIHAVSLGETRAADPLVRSLLSKGMPILLTHTTPTGRAEGARLFADAIATNQLRQAWLPYDFPGSTRRFIEFFMPRCGIMIEREVWPNLIHAAVKEGISVLLVSARLAESSLQQMRWARSALRRAYASLDLVLAQTEDDAKRLMQAGVFGAHVVGNLKFDVALSNEQLEEGRRWRQTVGRPVIAIASTRDGEEEMFAQGIARMRQTGEWPKRGGPLYIMIPRHPQRFTEAANVLDRHELRFMRRSAGMELPSSDIGVMLGDTLGEMAFYYAAADVAIIGGGFAPFGGQNLIEACVAGTPVIIGPYMHNFAQAADDALAAGAAIRVQDADEALRAAHALLEDAPRREAMREAALRWTAAHTGATQRIVEALRPWLGQSGR